MQELLKQSGRWASFAARGFASVLAAVAMAGLPMNAVGANDAEIVQLIGKGDARETAETEWVPANVRQKLSGGAFVRTREASQMALLLRDQTQVRLNQLSILHIKSVSAGAQPTRLELPQGRAWSQAKQRGSGEVAARKNPIIEVQTPAGMASIRGTDWELVVERDGTSTLTVLSGAVEFHNEHGSVSVLPNEQARAVPGRAPTKSLLTSAAERVQWVTAYRPQPRRWVRDLTAGAEAIVQRIETGDYADALPALSAPGILAPLPSALLLADLRLFLGEPRQAIDGLTAYAGEGNGDPMAAALLARALMISGRIGDAANILANALRKYPSHLELLLAQAELARLQGDASAALHAARSASELDPKNAEPWHLIGRIETEREFALAAREALARALVLRPDGPGYRGELATLETFANNFPAAEAAFRDALEQQPDDYVALTGLGVLQLKRGDTQAALESFLKSGVVEPRYARAALFTAVAYYRLGDRGRALETLEKAASSDERDPLPHLLASLIHQDALALGPAIDAARQAQLRMPYLKSLNQVLTDQKGTANLGAAHAAFGLEEWSQAYAYDSYSPYWSGSHLFLADRFSGSFNKNSELFKGFLSDPAVFGASNRYSSLVPVPGHYASVGLTGGRDYVAEVATNFTVNGYSVAATPLAYFVGYDRARADSQINATDADGRMRADGDNLLFGLGARPTHELGVFLFGNVLKYDGRLADNASGLTDDPFKIDYRRHDGGLNYKFGPTNQAWLKIGAGREQVPVSGALFSPDSADALNAAFGVVNLIQPSGRLNVFDYEVTQRDLQWRHTFEGSPELQLSWGLESATQTKPFLLETEFPIVPPAAATGVRVKLSNDERLESKSIYVSGRFKASTEIDAQLDLHYQEVKSNFATRSSIEVVGGPAFPAPDRTGATHEREINPRLGVRWRPARGHTFRFAAQAWRKPAGVNTLAPVDTLGVALDDRIVRAGGKLRRYRFQHEVEWGTTTFLQWFVDLKRAKNLDDPAVVADFALDQLERLRNRRRVYGLVADYLEDTPKFVEGHADLLGVSANHLLSREFAFAARYVRASTRNTSPALEGRALPFHPKHYLNAGLNWQPRARWVVSLSATYRGGRYRDDVNIEPLSSGWALGLSAYWESLDKRLSIAAMLDQIHSDKQSSIYRHPVAQLQATYRF